MDGEQKNISPGEDEKEVKFSEAAKTEGALKKEAEETAGKEEKDEDKEGFDFGRLLFGLLTLAFGFFLLGKNTGFFPEDVYIDIFQFWPVLIVVVGLSLLDTRRPFSFIFALLAFAAVAAFVGTILKDAVLEDDDGGRMYFPVGVERGMERDARGPISGPVEGI